MLSADFARCALTAVFVVLAATRESSLAAVAPVAVLLGACSALFMPASMAMMPSLVDSARLTSANSVYAGFVQVVLVVVLSANFALAGTTEVALPALAHARFGADGYGAVLACLAVAALAGALAVGKFADRFRPVTLIAGSLIAGAAGIAAAPFLGGLPGVAVGLAVLGVASGFDNVVSITLIQRWAPPAMLGRVWGLLTLASVGSFPVATFIAGLLVRHLGPSPVFPISGALLALSMLYGLSQREFRDFGTGDGAGDKETRRIRKSCRPIRDCRRPARDRRLSGD